MTTSKKSDLPPRPYETICHGAGLSPLCINDSASGLYVKRGAPNILIIPSPIP